MTHHRSATLALLLAACQPALDADRAPVAAPTVLAVIAEPPEARPGDVVELTVWAGDAAGPLGAVDARWSLCTEPRPAVEPGSVAVACLEPDEPFATGAEVDATLPRDACARFGPDPPPGELRPRDPDPTGGYYQPIAVALPDAVLAFGVARLRCGLDRAPFEVARAYAQRYVANQNPTVELGTFRDGARVALASAAPGEAVLLEAAWPASAAEGFVSLDLATLALVDRREAMRVDWYATAGALADDTTGRAEDDPATTATTTWIAPDEGAADLWAVLRDSRGGAAIAHARVTIRP